MLLFVKDRVQPSLLGTAFGRGTAGGLSNKAEFKIKPDKFKIELKALGL